jgi:hypothetical protein
VIFALIAYESLENDPRVSTVIGVIATTVTLSVIVHGVSATPWAHRYGAWVQRTQPAVESQSAAEPLPARRSSSPK